MNDVWIVGTGFSRGIGFELVQKIREQKYKILHIGRTKSGFEDAFLSCDLTQPLSEIFLFSLRTQLKNKNVCGFFYGAGIMPNLLELHDTPEKSVKFWASQNHAMQVNYLSCAQLTQEVIPSILKYVEREEYAHKNDDSQPSQNSPIQNPFVAHLTSLAAVDPLPGFELYGITKLACLKYFEDLAKKFNPSTLPCLSIHPGTVQTDMTTDLVTNPDYQTLPVVNIFQNEIKEGRVITAKQSAHEISKFLFDDTLRETRKSAHGKFYNPWA